MSRFVSATPKFGIGLELTAISGAVIGGASLTGGKGSVLGAILGITLLSLVTSSLILLDVNVYWQDFIKGLILLLAISMDSFGELGKNRTKKIIKNA
jgi:ribose transport system permease protein